MRAAVAEIELSAPTTLPENRVALENAEPTPPVSPPPALLFGEFDQEEKVAIGNEFAPRRPAPQPAPPSDLESMLHQEIVGICPVPKEESSPDEIIIENNDDTIECIEEPEPEPVEDFIEVADEGDMVADEGDHVAKISEGVSASKPLQS